MIVFLLTSCDAGKRVTLAHARQPKFINGIYLHGQTKTGEAANAIDTRTVATLPAQEAVASATSSEPAHAGALTAEEQRPEQHQGRTHFIFIKRKKQETEEETETSEPATTPTATATEEIEPAGLKYTDLVGIQGKDVHNGQLYNFITRWYGTRYRLGGQSEAGIDCSGFSRKLYDDVYGIELTRTAQDQYKSCKREKKADDAQEGDLVFFRQRGKRITHVGVYLANGHFIHSSTSQGVVISSLKEDYWRRHYAGIGKISRGGGVSGL
ncbi:hypothetical protein GCM10023093_24650 [Nemorincola caseinilytica]|uniref:NlpC/P60 domain-containing protein n=1 Tax=Nemorincola caseinilytica TaxID=2054315 RepID=A0ABP8NMU2_9BACT